MARHDEHGSARIAGDSTPTRTSAGDDATSRMAGTDSGRHDEGAHATHDGPHDGTHRAEHATTGSDERYEERVTPPKYRSAKTSVAAVFALVFGLAALFCALTGILAPAAVLFGLIGIVLGIAGLKMTKRLGVTGRGVAIGGLVTAVLGFLLGAAVLAGAAVYVNEQGLDRLQQQIDEAVQKAPSGREIVESVPGTN